MHEDVRAVGLDNKTRSKSYDIDKVYYKCHFYNAALYDTYIVKYLWNTKSNQFCHFGLKTSFTIKANDE